jgi:hypothetical protein
MIHDEIVAPALEYYDRAREQYKSVFDKLDPTKFKKDISDHDMEHNKITFFDSKNNEILTSNFEIVGVYSNIHKMWCWAWSVPILKKNETYISKKILSYGLDLESSLFLKTELVTSRFTISDKIQLDIHIAIATYLSKKIIYKYRHHTDENNKSGKKYIDFYIFLLDISPEQSNLASVPQLT